MPPFVVPVTPAPPVLTVEEGKLRAGLDWTADAARDALMANWIASATAHVQNRTGLALAPQTVDLYFESLPATLRLPSRPVRTLTSLSMVDDLGTPLVVAGGFILDGSSAEGRPAQVMLMTPTAALPGTLRSFLPWVVRLEIGWATVADIPPELVYLVGLLTAHYATVGRDMAQIGHIVAPTPFGFDDLIAPYELVTVA